MEKKRAVFPKELLNDDIEENNQRWINEYKKHTNYDNGYYQALNNFFRFKKFEKKAFNTFLTSDVGEYLETMIENGFGDYKITAIISNINSFRGFLVEKYPQMFSEFLLKDLPDLKMNIMERKNIGAKQLSLVQLQCVKEYIKDNIFCEYFFQIYYQLNIAKKDIKYCHPKYANKRKMVFENDKKQIPYNEKIQEILYKLEAMNLQKKYRDNISAVEFHLAKIEEHLKTKGIYNVDKNFTYGDIKKTHEAFFLKCSNCGKESESLSNNWVLAKVDSNNNDYYYLVCSKCKGVVADE